LSKRIGGIFYGWVIVAACFFAVMANAILLSFGVFYKPLITQFGWRAADVALAPSILSVVYLVMVLPVSWVYQKVSIKVVVLVGGILMGLGLALSSTITSLWQLYLFYGIIAGVGSSTIWVPFTSAIMNWFDHKRGIAMGIALSGYGLGSLVAAPSLSYIIETGGWRMAFLFSGVATFLILFSASLVAKTSPKEIGLKPYRSIQEMGHESFDESVASGNSSLHKAIRTKPFWLLYCLWISSQIVTSLYTQHIVLFALGLGISFILGSLGLGIIGLSSIIGRFVVGFFLDRVGIRRALLFCYLVTLLSALLLLVTRDALWLFLFATLFGFSFGGRSVLEVPITSAFFGLTHLAIIVGALETAFGVGGMIGPYLGGYAYDVTGGYSQVFLFCTLLAILSVAIVVFLKPSETSGIWTNG
jgi:predicted MFS family arabinose efflux permease